MSEGVSADHSSSTAQLIKPLNRYGSLKKLSFHVNEHFTDSRFTLRLFYDSELLRSNAPRDIAEIAFSGLPSKDKFNIVDTPKVTLSFRLSPLGFVVVEHADVEFTILTLEKEKEKEEEKKGGEEGKEGVEAAGEGSEGNAQSEEKGEESEKKEEKGAGEGEVPTSGGEEEEKKEVEEKFVEVKRVKKVALKVDVKAKGVVPLSTKEVNDAKKKLRDMDAHDKLKFETEEVGSLLSLSISRCHKHTLTLCMFCPSSLDLHSLSTQFASLTFLSRRPATHSRPSSTTSDPNSTRTQTSTNTSQRRRRRS